ncbi:MAG: phospho-sugar mutase [Clostridia bacterium]|nr:phospho-sugar mutase [Clostridia bacterium]
MTIQDRYNHWLTFDEETRAELQAIADPKEIEDRFYRDLEFGTGGLRGVMGAGTNRMNAYTVRRATLGLANDLKSRFACSCQVAIAYDSRNLSREFAAEAASVLCAAGIQVALFKTLMPTPVLSFAVQHLGCQAGICITASHNPKEYNGYKVYDQTGCQILPDDARRVIEQVNAITEYQQIPVLALHRAAQNGLLYWIGDDVLEVYLAEVRKQSIYKKPSDIQVVFTPLHGTGNIPVRAVLEPFHVSVVASQAQPDGDFSTVRSPNPEERDALTLGIEQALAEGADIVLGTDPDCDRVGVAVQHQGDFILLTGNQIGALLVDFVTRHRPVQDGALLVKTIVTNELGATIGRSRGLAVEDTLTGFKYIGDRINYYEKTGAKQFVVGYEESFGYLVGTHARDKDAVVASLLIVEMAAWHKNQGHTLIDALNDLYLQYGFFLDALDAFTLKGADGAEKIQAIMAQLRTSGQSIIPALQTVKDYAQGIDGLPAENVLKFILADHSWIAVRPSGTEPKIKIYYSIQDENKKEAQKRLDMYRALFRKFVEA